MPHLVLCWSIIKWTCTSVYPITLQWLLEDNGHLLLPNLQLPGIRGWKSWSLPLTSVNIGPTIVHSIQRGCCFVACFFINEDRTYYVSVGFYPARDYLPLVEFGVLRSSGGPKTLIIIDEQVDALAETLSTLREDMCNGGAGGCSCESGAIRLDVTRSRRTARLYVDSQFISLTLQGIEYLSRTFNIVQQRLRDYIMALQDVLPFVTKT
jgi:hypothetical protein